MRPARPLALYAALLLGACVSPGTVATNGDDSAAAADGQVTWWADVQPIVQQTCARCHQPDGQGVGDLTRYPVASAMAEIMLAQIDAGHMPPPASDPACRDYLGSEALVLPDGARETVAAWIQAGTPEGDPRDAVEGPVVSTVLEDPDFEVRVPAPHEPSFGADGNEWRCFVVDGVPDDDYFLTAMQATLDEASMVHHIVLYSLNADAPIDAYRSADGFDCFGGEQHAITQDAIGVWAPGMMPVELPDGVGIPMQGGVPLLLEFHYFDPGDLDPGAADRSGYAFRTAETVETVAYPYTWGITDMVIPAGDPSYTRSTSAEFGGGWDYTLYTMWPHMHVLGDAYDVRVTRRDGDQDCLVTSDGYSFDDQYVYAFREPYVARAGSTVEYACTWNNSESNPDQIHDTPQTVTYGAGSQDEMCFFYGLYSVEAATPYVLVDQVLAGQVSVLDSADDVSQDGQVLLALDYGGVGAELDGVTFEPDAGPAYAASGPSAPTLAADQVALQSVLGSLIYDEPGVPLTLTHAVVAGEPLSLQLLFYESYYTEQGFRSVDVHIDGALVLEGLDVHTNATTGGVLYTVELTPEGDEIQVQVRGNANGDGYAVLSGLVLTAAP